MVIAELTQYIKAEAMRLGFSACGIAKAEPVDSNVADDYRRWLREGKHAGMAYLENNLDKRLDPTLLMPGAKSIISLALNYYPERKLNTDQYQFAYYAYGKDYHDVIKAKLQELVASIKDKLAVANPVVESQETVLCSEALPQETEQYKLCVDTVPMLDRYWAWKAGLGWIGKNTNLIIPKAGSFFFLAELIVDFELEYDSPMDNHCGTCTKCLDACPTGALCAPNDIDATKCLSYLTIEHRGDFDLPFTNYHLPFGSAETSLNSNLTPLTSNPSSLISNLTTQDSQLTPLTSNPSSLTYIYGCDRCQLACPYNKFAQPTKIKEFTPSDEFLTMRPSDWKSLTVEQYRTLFKGSAVKRAKYEGLVRNIKLMSSDP